MIDLSIIHDPSVLTGLSSVPAYYDRKRIHNLKYYTWVEQQGKTYQEIQVQWYNPTYWTGIQNQVDKMDALVDDFNQRTGLGG